MTLNEIGVKYNISYSVFNIIKQKSIEEINHLKTRKINSIYWTKKEITLNLIKNFYQSKHTSTTAKEITAYINKTLKINYEVNFIRKFMKQQANLSYKRIKPRPNKINLERVKIIRKLFAYKFTKLVSNKTLIVNIDESSINRRVSSKYSWGFKGSPIELKNSPFYGSVNLVLAIYSNGAWISFITNKTIDSLYFLWFINILDSWLKSKNNFKYEEIMLILDNWSFHKSLQTRELLRKLKYLVVYLPAYSPDFFTDRNVIQLYKEKSKWFLKE